MFSTECVRMHGFRKQYGYSGNFSFSCLLTLDLDNFRFIQVDFVAEGGFLLIIHIGFRKFWWISWISIFRPPICPFRFHYEFMILCDFQLYALSVKSLTGNIGIWIIYYLINGYPDSKLSVLSIPSTHMTQQWASKC